MYRVRLSVHLVLVLLCLCVVTPLVSAYSSTIFHKQVSVRYRGNQIRESARSVKYRNKLYSRISQNGGDDSSNTSSYTHNDIEWKITTFEDTTKLQRLKLRLASKAIRLDCAIKGQTSPPVLCPKGGKAVLEARIRPSKRRLFGKAPAIARFGLTTNRGPSCPLIDDTIREVYQREPNNVHIGAIIFMVVEEAYRSRNIGTLALEVIGAIQAHQGCDFTMLVADDNGSGDLIKWYEGRSFTRAPKLQDLMGSPNEQNGVSMIGFTREYGVKAWDNLNLKW